MEDVAGAPLSGASLGVLIAGIALCFLTMLAALLIWFFCFRKGLDQYAAENYMDCDDYKAASNAAKGNAAEEMCQRKAKKVSTKKYDNSDSDSSSDGYGYDDSSDDMEDGLMSG